MSSKFKLNLYAFITVFIWASAFPLTKLACQEFSPNSLGLVRCTVASLVLLSAAKINHIRLPFHKKDILYFIAAGGMGFTLYMIFFNTGMLTLTSATSSIIIAATPVLTAAGAGKFFGEKISAAGWVSIIMAFIGVVILLMWNGILSINTGILWTVAAMLVFCVYNLISRKLSYLGYTSAETVTYSMICGAVLLTVFIPDAASELSGISLKSILIAVYLGIMPSALSYVLWGKAMGLADRLSEVTNYMFITPLLSALMGFALLREIPDAGTLIGGIIIISSVIMFNIRGK